VAKVDMNLIQQLRDRTGVGMMDCKKALEEADGNIDKAVEILRKKGAAVALKRADKATSEGMVHAYIHPGNRIGVLLELNCETDFVANTPAFKQLAQDLGMQIAAMKPLYLSPEDVDPKFLEAEKDILRDQLKTSGKPEKVIDQILEGKLQKLFSEICLLKQQFIKDDKLTVEQVVQELIAKTGENIKIRRFVRYELGA
jgi:elongation factor Ts